MALSFTFKNIKSVFFSSESFDPLIKDMDKERNLDAVRELKERSA